MVLTRGLKDTVKARAERDPEFRVALLQEALDVFLDADLATGKALLRDDVNATVGFEQLGADLPARPRPVNPPEKSAPEQAGAAHRRTGTRVSLVQA